MRPIVTPLRTLRRAAVAIIASLAATATPAQPAAAQDRPNIVVVMVDDVGWKDLGVYGSRFHETPHLDRLASQGIRFTDHQSAAPVCTPTRAAFLTGLHPVRTGMTAPVGHLPRIDLELRLDAAAAPGVRFIDALSATRLDPRFTTFPEKLREAGYRTIHLGKWHLGYNRPGHPEDRYEPRDHGFDVDHPAAPAAEGPMSGYFAPFLFVPDPALRGEPGQHIEDVLSARAAEYIRSAPKGQPFYLQYWSYSAHYPWGAKPGYVAHFEKKPRDPTGRQRNAVYAAMLRSMDEGVGTILAAIDEAGLASNTIVVFTSDNGGQDQPPSPKFPIVPAVYQSVPVTSNLPLRSGKASLYEGGTRVPLIVRWPGRTPAGRESAELITTVDLFPTLLRAAGVAPDPSRAIDGVDQSAALAGGRSARTEAYAYFPHGGGAEAKFIAGFQPGAWVRQGQWKLLRFFADGPGGADRHELYDLATDVGETRDLAARNPRKVAELARRIDAFLKDTNAVIPRRNPAWDPKLPPGFVDIDR